MVTQEFITKFTDLLQNTPGFNPKHPDFIQNTINNYQNTVGMQYRIPVIVPLHEAKKFFADAQYKDYVYVRPWGVFLVDIGAVVPHDMFMGNLWAFFKACETGRGWDHNLSLMGNMYKDDFGNDAADKFLSDCYGVYLSSVGTRLQKDESFIMNAQERMVFNSLND
jgi:hypothetical protein